jgi:hypothetical protein
VICPSCQSAAATFACDVGQITSILSPIPRPQEGRIAIVTDVGCGMRWTLAAHQTNAQRGGRRSRVVLMPRRRHQVLKKLTLLRDDGDKKARSPGRARSKPLKPIAQGRPVRSGEPVVTNSYVFHFYIRGCGCAWASGFPCALCFDEGRSLAKPGRMAPRDRCAMQYRPTVRNISRLAKAVPAGQKIR